MKSIFVLQPINGKYVFINDIDTEEFFKHEKKYNDQYLAEYGQVRFVEAGSPQEAEEISNS